MQPKAAPSGNKLQSSSGNKSKFGTPDASGGSRATTDDTSFKLPLASSTPKKPIQVCARSVSVC